MRTISLCLLGLFCAACSFRHNGFINKPEPEIVPLNPEANAPAQPMSPGSIYAANNFGAAMISDAKAYRINDIVLIRIIETTSASSSATTDLEKANSASLKIPSVFGLESGLSGIFAEGSTDGTVLGTGTTMTHEGTGTTQRAGSFSGNVAARVINVLPNGYLVIQGVKSVQINSELQNIYLRGLVNPLMIDNNHSVLSSEVADLELRYQGRGVVTAQQNPGLFYRIINALWPF